MKLRLTKYFTAHNNKDLLNKFCHQYKRSVGDFHISCVDPTNKFYCSVEIIVLNGRRRIYRGESCTSKKKSVQSAAEVAYRAELEQELRAVKGEEIDNISFALLEEEDSVMHPSEHTSIEVNSAEDSAAAATHSLLEASKTLSELTNYKGTLLDFFTKYYFKKLVPFFDTRWKDSGKYICIVKITLFNDETSTCRSYTGEQYTKKIDAEQSAAKLAYQAEKELREIGIELISTKLASINSTVVPERTTEQSAQCVPIVNCSSSHSFLQSSTRALNDINYKGKLLEFLAKMYSDRVVPHFNLEKVGDTGKYSCTVTIEEKNISTSTIRSYTGEQFDKKKHAQQSAAETAYHGEINFRKNVSQAVLVPSQPSSTMETLKFTPIDLLCPSVADSSPSSEVTVDTFSRVYGGFTEIDTLELPVPFEDILYVTCAENHVLGPLRDFCFFWKSPTEVHFCTKPEVEFTTLHTEPMVQKEYSSAKISNILCSKCVSSYSCKGAKLGKMLNIGPENSFVRGFKVEKVKLFGSLVSEKKSNGNTNSWKSYSQQDKFSCIEQRDMNTYLPGCQLEHQTSNKSMVSTIFPKSFDDFQVKDLIPDEDDEEGRKIAKLWQEQAFYHACKKNTIVVVPTGNGKTFMATLLIQRFRKLNPNKTVLFVVERIPLAYQQAKAIRNDAPKCRDALVLCSENSSGNLIREISEGKYSVVICTAGAFKEHLENEKLRICDFSLCVFDECHHATKNHPYVAILNAVKLCPIQFRPRLLGLTATPVSSKSPEKALIKVEELSERFIHAKYFRPVFSYDSDGTEYLVVKLTDFQVSRDRDLCGELYEKMKEICSITGEKIGFGVEDLYTNVKLWATCTGICHCAPPSESSKRKLLEGQSLVFKVQLNYLLGPLFSEGVTNISRLLGPSIDHSQWSSQLWELFQRIKAASSTDRILVFVDSKALTSLLQEILTLLIPDLVSGRIVGHGGGDGMNYRGDGGQKMVLEKFKAGVFRLLVCTSVLEEGIDVQNCNLVFRFGGTPHLIQLVQSRGRARAAGGKLYVIHTDLERDHFEAVRNEHTFIGEILRKYTMKVDGVPSLGDGNDLSDGIPSYEPVSTSFMPATSRTPTEELCAIGKFKFYYSY